jgi:hypothetical protein
MSGVCKPVWPVGVCAGIFCVHCRVLDVFSLRVSVSAHDRFCAGETSVIEASALCA